MSQDLFSIIASGRLPASEEPLLEILADSNGRFVSTEGDLWDFKQDWPKVGQPYFNGIVRLICGFHNNEGGIIVFGVHDQTRKGGHNTQDIDLDAFYQAVNQLIGKKLDFEFRRYNNEKYGSFDVLLVPQARPEDMPVRFQQDGQPYKAGTIWIREKNEVLQAEPRHLFKLYCRQSAGDAENTESVRASLPPSPATIKQFVGRVNTIDKIFDWLKNSDQPRLFLWGKGGSGKSTIAFEVAKMLTAVGSSFRIAGKNPIDQVIFLSAKKTELNPAEGKQVEFRNNDFSDARGLFEAILLEGYTDLDTFSGVEDREIIRQLEQLFENFSLVVVVDDIDTLTTQGIDAGFDTLFRILSRSRKESRILYTQRNFPTHSIANSVEVPGLEVGGEYEEFVRQCAQQFRIEPPRAEFVSGKLMSISERRPLIIESVVALKRRADSYERAADMFQQGAGDDARGYVFRREWEAIPASSNGRELLAVLSMFKRPVVFDDLADVMSLDASRLSDAISATQEMFLSVTQKGDTQAYSLEPLTMAFVQKAATQIDRFDFIKARVQKFRSQIYAQNPELSRIVGQTERLIREAELTASSAPIEEAWGRLAEISEPAITQDPRFMSLRGYVALKLDPPRLQEARDNFSDSFSMRYAPEINYVREWFKAERVSGLGDQYTAKILELVGKAKGYDASIFAEFQFRRASFLFFQAKNGISVEPVRSLERLCSAIKLHCSAYPVLVKSHDYHAEPCWNYCRNATYFLLQQLARAGQLTEALSLIEQIVQEVDGSLDAISSPVSEFVRAISVRSFSKTDRYQIANKVADLKRAVEQSSHWGMERYRSEVAEALRLALVELRRESA